MRYRDLVLADNPVAYWPLDDLPGQGAADLSGNALAGAYGANAELAQPPLRKVGKSVRGKGLALQTMVVVPHDDRLRLTGSLTIEAWVRISTAGVFMSLLRKEIAGAANPAYTLSLLDNGRIHLSLWMQDSTAGRLVLESPASIADNQPHLITFVKSGQDCRLYIDATVVAQATWNNSVRVESSPLGIGCSPPLGVGYETYPLAGWMQDVALYASGLTLEKIQARLASGQARYRLSGVAKLDTGVAASDVLVRQWDGQLAAARVVPAADGAWSADVEDTPHDVTIRGPAGYQPITHGPVTPVAVV